MAIESQFDPALRLTAAAAPIALAVIRANGRIVVANPAWEASTGWTPEELVGRRLLDVVSADARLYLQTHCFPILQSGGTVAEAAIEVVAPDGRSVPMLLYASRDALSGELHLALTSARARHVEHVEFAACASASAAPRISRRSSPGSARTRSRGWPPTRSVPWPPATCATSSPPTW